MILDLPIEKISSQKLNKLWSLLYKASIDIGWSSNKETKLFFKILLDAVMKQSKSNEVKK